MMRERWKAARLRGRTAVQRQPLEPERQLPDLKHWEGLWVAVKDSKVIAAAHNSRDLVPRLVEMGEAGRGAVAQYVPRYSDTVAIGVG